MSMTGLNRLQLRRRLRATTVLACITAVGLSGALSGCAGTGIGGSSYTVSADDICASERTQLKSFQDYFFQAMVQGAATGALLGGISGLLIGGDAKGALIGAGTGAVLGGATGYFTAKQRATSDPVQLTQAVYSDVYKENQQIDSVTASFLRLRDCRFQGAQLIKADFAAGRMNKADAQAKLGLMRQRFQEDIAFAEELNSKIASRGAEYDGASNEVLKFDPTARDRALQREAAERAAQQQAEQQQLQQQRQQQQRQQQQRQQAAPRPAPAPVRVAAASPPPQDASGVVQLTETNQLKRKALADDVASAKVAAASTFDLEGGISRSDQRDAAPA